MSSVTVFVDDAVQGRLPAVCAASGERADGLHRIHAPIGGSSGWLWLLIFLGPIGLVALVAVSLASRTRDLVVRLPYSQDALDRERAAFRAAVIAGGACGVGIVGLIVVNSVSLSSPVHDVLMWAVAVATLTALFLTVALGLRYRWVCPRIDLDASGRWVVLGRVHPNFAEACTRHQAVDRAASVSTTP